MSFVMSNIMTSHCNDSTLKGVIKPHCNNFSYHLDAAERKDRRKIGRSFLWLSGSATWLHRAGNNDLLRRTSGCCEANLLFGTPEEALEFPATLPFRPFRSGGFQA